MKYRNLASAMCACFVVGLVVLLLAGQAFATPASLAAYRAAVLADGPSGYWTLDETSGTTAADIAPLGGANDGNYDVGAPGTRPGFIAGSNAFDSSGPHEYIRISDTGATAFTNNAMGSSEFSMEAWVYHDDALVSPPENYWVRGFFFGAGGQYAQHNGSSLAAGVNNGGPGGIHAPIKSGQWVHHVMTVEDDPNDPNASIMHYYMNETAPGPGHMAPDPNPALQLAIGPIATPRVVDNSGEDIQLTTLHFFSYPQRIQGLDGGIDEVAYYDYALSGAQVAAHFNAIPEPSSLALLSLSGLAGFLGVRRRRR